MPKVYIAAAFRSLSRRDQNPQRAYGELVDAEYIKFLEDIEEVFLRFGFDTCLPHRDEGMWGKRYYEPATISSLCYRHIVTSDLVFGIAEAGRGVHIELGYAAHARKDLILMYREGKEPSTLIWGLPNDLSPWKLGFGGETEAMIRTYKDETDLLAVLNDILVRLYPRPTAADSCAQRLAIIDIGSQTLKLKILSHRRGGYPRTVHAEARSLGIMGDVLASGKFSSETIQGVASQLLQWKKASSDFGCHKVVVTGTAALRKATNTSELTSAITAQTGFAIVILDPKEELARVYAAVRSTFPSEAPIAVMNLGGGSVQVGVGQGLTPSRCHYLDFGTKEITTRWPWKKGMSQEDYHAMRDHVRSRVQGTIRSDSIQVSRMVHTGGELDFMLRCQVPLLTCTLSPQHVSEIATEMFDAFASQFYQLDPETACSAFGLDPAWATGAVASNTIASCIAEAIGASAIIPSNLNVADGFLVDLPHNES